MFSKSFTFVLQQRPYGEALQNMTGYGLILTLATQATPW